jgi:competence protein ComEA
MRRFLPVFLACTVVSVGLASWEGLAQQTSPPAAPGVAPKVGEAVKKKLAEQIDLNKATEGQLEALPGIQKATAKKIVAGRPYTKPEDLVTKNVVSQETFDRIKQRIQVKQQQ